MARTLDAPDFAGALSELDRSVAAAADALIREQRDDGHWSFELEADATIPAEFILLGHYLDRIDAEMEAGLARYLRAIQGAHGGWPLFHDGPFDLSASVKAYFALKAVGDDPEAPHMARARDAILAAGGAARANVFTRIQLALFGALDWKAVPSMPVEIMLLPRWFPFHLSKVSYWSRTVIVPLLVLMAMRPKARNPRKIRIRELFSPGTAERPMRPGGSIWAVVFGALDAVLHVAEPWFPRHIRRRAIAAAVAFVEARLNGEDGLGGIYPAMANSAMMFDCLGYAPDHPSVATVRAALRKLLVLRPERSYCQPCLSPVWDTGLAALALMETGDEAGAAAARRGLDWLIPRQELSLAGDWAGARPEVRPGGWAFQYWNAHYPDLDDTAMVAIALDRCDGPRYREAVDRAAEWIVGMRCKSGGWAAFDADNDSRLVAALPFCDFGEVTDPPSADVTAHVVEMLAAEPTTTPGALARGVEWLWAMQEADGSWFGRWGVNYVYGTGAVIPALVAAGVDATDGRILRAVRWLEAHQNDDGGWGEDVRSYVDTAWIGRGESTASQTAWALLALLAAGGRETEAVERGITWLVCHQTEEGGWDEPWFTGTGFPWDFSINYHLYRLVWPLMALGRYQRQ